MRDQKIERAASSLRFCTEQSIELEVTRAAKDLLTKERDYRVFGVRPLSRVITR